MRVKLDENLPAQLKSLFTDTVIGELGGAEDMDVATPCIGEERVLVTQDLDFADIRTYPPAEYFGIVVFRLSTAARDAILQVVSPCSLSRASATDPGRPARRQAAADP